MSSCRPTSSSTRTRTSTQRRRQISVQGTNSRYGPEIMVAKAMRFPQTPKEVFAFWDECGIAKGLRRPVQQHLSDR
ncbi:MAG: hypothetical protein WDN24_15150 [Sphingomonas sp.]